MKIKKVRAPVRIDFGGGTTDIEPFYSKYGGAVLNCAISRYVVGKLVVSDKKTHLEYNGDIPTSSGLGTSGVMNLVWLALISQTPNKFNPKNKRELAEKVYDLEQTLGLVGGKQDQYAAAFGGINFFEFDKRGRVKISPVKISKKVLRELESKLVLVYSGKSHYSGDSNGAMIRDLKKGKNLKSFKRVKEIAYEMRRALEKGDLDLFAELMNKETANRRKLATGIVGVRLQKVIDDGMKNGAIGAKVCGSGGGGSVLFFGDATKLKKKFGSRVIGFKFDFGGLRWLK